MGEGSREFVLEGHRVSCLVPTSGRSGRGVNFGVFGANISFGLKQPVLSYQLLGDIGGALSLAQRGVWICR